MEIEFPFGLYNGYESYKYLWFYCKPIINLPYIQFIYK